MKTYLFWLAMLCFVSYGQKSVAIDARLQPLLDEFFVECDKYGIAYHDKLHQLEKIDITNSLSLKEDNMVMGMVTRDAKGNIENILVNWVTLVDPEIVKVVAFHEFAHHFLEHKHTCDDCNEIMAVNNSSYFDVARDWENQVELMFKTSPVYVKMQQDLTNSSSPVANLGAFND